MFPQTIAGSQSGAERQGSGALPLHLGNALITVGSGIRFGLGRKERREGEGKKRKEVRENGRKTLKATVFSY